LRINQREIQIFIAGAGLAYMLWMSARGPPLPHAKQSADLFLYKNQERAPPMSTMFWHLVGKDHGEFVSFLCYNVRRISLASPHP